ncbi:hypothetical protein [Desulfobacter curvatus]|uniref:hypothetical protein n=1 Tax=Desulfobacter curvatus TaxID=2290 RepID=UPI00036DCAD3|nr:hypothetical protein [Desulfobacter curvatus]
MANLYEDIPDKLPYEHFKDLIKKENIRIERIVSLGHSSPEFGWYDQDENEWVIVLEGSGSILFETALTHQNLLSMISGGRSDI